MNTKSLAKNYVYLNPAERFSLMLHARSRGDDAETERIIAAARMLSYSAPDYSPYARAFSELSHFVFIELLDLVGRYRELFALANNRSAEAMAAKPADDRSYSQRVLYVAFAKGFLLKTQAESWRLFCEKLNVPPYSMWEFLPGKDRLKDTIDLAETFSFDRDGMIGWLKAINPVGSEISLFTIEEATKDLWDTFHVRLRWWGG